MAARDYEDFDLLVEGLPDGRYRARVLGGPKGPTPPVEFSLPFEKTALENLLLRLDPGRSSTRRGSANPQVTAAREFGAPLFEAVFTGPVGQAWSAARAAAGPGHGLRLRLHLSEAPAVASLPWELLHDRTTNSYIAQSERTPIVRYLDVPGTLHPLPLDGPLSVLVVISSPTDLPSLDVDAEWARVTEALEPRMSAGLVRLQRLAEPSVPELGRHLRRESVHVLHFVGHGDYDSSIDDGVLYFCDAYGRSSPVTASILGPYVHDHDPLRLVVLNACRSASVDSEDPFGGMAQGLVQQNASAVVAMQFPITDRAAVTFTGELYGALVDGLPVDQAVTSTRKALAATFGAEWATPVLFLHSDDTQLFTELVAVPPLEVTPPPVPPVASPEASPPSALARGAAVQVATLGTTDAPPAAQDAAPGVPEFPEAPPSTSKTPATPTRFPPVRPDDAGRTDDGVDHADDRDTKSGRRVLAAVASGLVALLLAVGVWFASSGDDADRPTAASTTSTSASSVTTGAPTPTASDSPTSNETPSPQVSAPSVPDSAIACSSRVFAGPKTSCPFALNVEVGWQEAGRGTVRFTAFSPVTQLQYDMRCQDGELVVCRAQTEAIVYIRP